MKKIQVLEKTSGERKTVICGDCGHKEENLLVTEAIIYFPNRMVYINHRALPHRCTGCYSGSNLVIFGEQACKSNYNVINNPNIVENNRLFDLKNQK